MVFLEGSQKLGIWSLPVGITGDELWFRFANGPQAADGMVAEHYSYDVFDLRTGTHRAASDAWAST